MPISLEMDLLISSGSRLKPHPTIIGRVPMDGLNIDYLCAVVEAEQLDHGSGQLHTLIFFMSLRRIDISKWGKEVQAPSESESLRKTSLSSRRPFSEIVASLPAPMYTVWVHIRAFNTSPTNHTIQLLRSIFDPRDPLALAGSPIAGATYPEFVPTDAENARLVVAKKAKLNRKIKKLDKKIKKLKKDGNSVKASKLNKKLKKLKKQLKAL